MVEKELRLALAAAIQVRADATSARSAALDVAEKARAALAAAADTIAQAELEAEQFGGLNAKIAQHHAEQLRAGDPVGALPKELRTEQRARQEAIDRRDALRQSVNILTAEATAAEAVVKQSELAVTLSAGRILVAEAESMADEIRAARRTIYRRLHDLKAIICINDRFPPAAPRAVVLPPRDAAVFFRAEVEGNSADERAAMKRFADFFLSLSTDANAELAPPERLFGDFPVGAR